MGFFGVLLETGAEVFTAVMLEEEKKEKRRNGNELAHRVHCIKWPSSFITLNDDSYKCNAFGDL